MKWRWDTFFLGFEVYKVALGHVFLGFEVYRLALGHVFLRLPWFFHDSNIRQMVRTHLVSHSHHCINLARLKNEVLSSWDKHTYRRVCRTVGAVGNEGPNMFLTFLLTFKSTTNFCFVNP